MLGVTVKVRESCIVSPGEEKERLQWEGFAEKEGFKFLYVGPFLFKDTRSSAN